jgi:hypothetical protein
MPLLSAFDKHLRCPCGLPRILGSDLEIQPTNGFESHLFVAPDPSTPKGAPWPKVKVYCCRGCASLYAQAER